MGLGWNEDLILKLIVWPVKMTLDELYLCLLGEAISEDGVEDQQDSSLDLGTGVWSGDSYCKHLF